MNTVWYWSFDQWFDKSLNCHTTGLHIVTKDA